MRPRPLAVPPLPRPGETIESIDDADILDVMPARPARTSPPARAFVRSAPPPPLSLFTQTFTPIPLTVDARSAPPPAFVGFSPLPALSLSDADDEIEPTWLRPRRRRSAVPWLALAAVVAIGAGLWRDPSARARALTDARAFVPWTETATASAGALVRAAGLSRASAPGQTAVASVLAVRSQPSPSNPDWAGAPKAPAPSSRFQPSSGTVVWSEPAESPKSERKSSRPAPPSRLTPGFVARGPAAR